MFPEINAELIKIIPEWAELLKISDSMVCVHTLGVVYCAMQDENFCKLSKREQNVIKWACLLHDIKKQGPPVFEGKDHMHPFKGGSAVLDIFSRLGLI